MNNYELRHVLNTCVSILDFAVVSPSHLAYLSISRALGLLDSLLRSLDDDSYVPSDH